MTNTNTSALETPALDDEIPGYGRRANTGRAVGRQRREAERVEDRRANRVPMHQQKVIETEGLPAGYHYHWALDQPGRIDKLLLAGYAFVEKNGESYSDVIHMQGTDSRVSKSGRDGKLYLMRIPMDLYLEDQKAKAQKADEQLAAVTDKMSGPGFYGRDHDGKTVSVANVISRGY